MVITELGEIYSWGAGGSGRLGNGSVDTLISPAQVQNNWQAVNDQEGPKNEDDNELIYFLQHKVSKGDSLESFKDIVILLQGENTSSLISKLKIKEKLILKQINHLKNIIQSSKDTQVYINKFENQINKIILQRRYQLKIEAFNINTT